MRSFEQLEPDAGKLARPVLRGGSGSNVASLPDMDIVFLGETTHSKLIELQKLFCKDYLDTILVSRDKGGTFIPPWAFEYPDKFCKQKAPNNAIKQLRELNAPSWDTIQSFNLKPLPIYLAYGLSVPEAWYDLLPSQQKKFTKRLEHRVGFERSLPYVFLTVLTHFLETLRESFDEAKDDPYNMYVETLFVRESESLQYPLGIFDPLEIVHTLCKALETLWCHRHQNKIQEFKIFKLNGRGLFRGKRHPQEPSFTTLLAYCGGRIEGKGKCGHYPLVIGKHETCEHCGKLICSESKCKFCNDKCKGLLRKQAK